MPLLPGKSRKAFKHNMEAEMDSGKPQDQALAIAYSVKRKKKKMAHGGEVKNESAISEQRPMPEEKAAAPAPQMPKPSRMPLKMPKMVPTSSFSVRMRDQEEDPKMDQPMPESIMEHEEPEMDQPDLLAEGGMIDMDQELEDEDEMEHAASIASAIMSKRQKLAEGGEILSHDSIYSDESDMADLSRNADEDANEEDQLSFNALRKENYSESEGLEDLDSPMDSNEHDEQIESDLHERKMISAIRSRMKKKSPISR